MNEILLGSTRGNAEAVTIDMEKLLLTRLLITANSGGGKSWLIRRLAEQICQRIPVIMIDLEGEYSTLREKFPFILIGPGGEAPADCRSAKFTMHKMLELRTSAIFDLSELETYEKHRYVRLISEAAINSPKEFWRDTVFIFDEAHIVCPENGKGQSEARSAVLGFPTRGRKRGFGCIFSTQRLAKLAYDARAEMLNRIIGMMIEPDDIKVAAGILGVKADHDFNRNMRTMTVGNFYGFGRAICVEPKLFLAGPVQTSHESRKSKHGVKAPPTPSELKRLLPQLADLPAQADDEAQTIEGLRQQLREARQLAARQTLPATKTETKIVKQRILTPAESKRLTKLGAQIDSLTKLIASVPTFVERLTITGDGIKDEAANLRRLLTPDGKIASAPVPPKPEARPAAAPVVANVYKPTPPKAEAQNGIGDITGGAFEILRVCAQYKAADDSQIAVLTGYKRTSRMTFRSRLLSAGFIVPDGNGWTATAEGIARLGNYERLPEGQALREYWQQRLTGGEKDIFEIYVNNYPNPVALSDLLNNSSYKRTSIMTFKSRLLARKLIVGGTANPNLFS